VYPWLIAVPLTVAGIAVALAVCATVWGWHFPNEEVSEDRYQI